MSIWRAIGLMAIFFPTLQACGGENGEGDAASGGAGDGTAPMPSAEPSVGTAGTAAMPTPDGPPGSSMEELAAFLQSEAYRGDGWTAQTAAPRAASSTVSPHGRVRVWRNDTLIASLEAGNGADLDAPGHETGSMVVKEFYDDADQMLGQASMLKLEGIPREWVYYCGGPDERCMDTAPYYGVDLDAPTCGFCHGGFVFTNTL